MQTIQIDVSDNIYDNVMFFLNNLPKKDIKLYSPKKKIDTIFDKFNIDIQAFQFNRDEANER